MPSWDLKDFKFQVFPSRQDRKTNLFICFLGEVSTRQCFCEIYWPLKSFDTPNDLNLGCGKLFKKVLTLISNLIHSKAWWKFVLKKENENTIWILMTFIQLSRIPCLFCLPSCLPPWGLHNQLKHLNSRTQKVPISMGM